MRGLIVDWGGVLAIPSPEAFRAFLAAEGVSRERFGAVIQELLSDTDGSQLHELELGRLPAEQFEVALARRLRQPGGPELRGAGLLARMLTALVTWDDLVDVIARAREAGMRTALLSNSWGLDYPRDGWDTLFDAVVLSGEVGMRKPEPGIYRHTAALLDLPPEQCVFVDDLAHNVRGAVAVGMVGVHHTDPDATIAELEVLLDLPGSATYRI